MRAMAAQSAMIGMKRRLCGLHEIRIEVDELAKVPSATDSGNETSHQNSGITSMTCNHGVFIDMKIMVAMRPCPWNDNEVKAGKTTIYQAKFRVEWRRLIEKYRRRRQSLFRNEAAGSEWHEERRRIWPDEIAAGRSANPPHHNEYAARSDTQPITLENMTTSDTSEKAAEGGKSHSLADTSNEASSDW